MVKMLPDPTLCWKTQRRRRQTANGSSLLMASNEMDRMIAQARPLRAVGGLDESGATTIEQWRFRSEGIKPTVLRHLDMPEADAIIHSHELHEVHKPEQGLIGLNADGQWRTSEAKEHPRQLGKALAVARKLSSPK